VQSLFVVRYSPAFFAEEFWLSDDLHEFFEVFREMIFFPFAKLSFFFCHLLSPSR